MNVFYELFQELPRQGPGNNDCTRRAYDMIPKLTAVPRILDVGCGVGVQTLELARISSGYVTALDNYQQFLDELEKKAITEKLAGNIETVLGNMFKMEFDDGSFDLIWAEGSIYIMGVENALKNWRKLLRSGGYIVASELTWLKSNPPQEMIDFWKKEYPGIKTIEDNLRIIEQCNYEVIGHFTIPDSAWWEDFYTPLEGRIKELDKKYKNDPKALEVIDSARVEVQMFRKYSEWYGYEFFVMQMSD